MRNFIPILCLSVVLSSMGHPASSSAEGTGFCLPVDSERLDRHLQRAAAKPAHELGHAFGLWHNFNDGAYIMSYGPEQSRLSELSAGHLAVHPFFNPDSPTETATVGELPTGQVLSSRSYQTGATSVPVRLELSDPDGLQQASLFLTTPETHFSAGAPELKTGRLLGGATNAIVDFEYDGIIPSDREHTNLATLLTHRMEFEVVDMLGNIGRIGLSLLHNSTHKLVISLDKDPSPGQIWSA